MNAFRLRVLVASLVLTLAASAAHRQLEPSCEKNSPERRGEIGCSLVENKALPEAGAASVDALGKALQVVNQSSNSISVFAIDATSGHSLTRVPSRLARTRSQLSWHSDTHSMAESAALYVVNAGFAMLSC
jgi:hypothetical protein